MRVLAIAQHLRERPGKDAAARRGLVQRPGHPGAHRRIIGPGARIGDLRQPAPEGEGGLPAMRVQLGQKRRVIGHVHHHIDEAVILCRRPDHRRPADVDIFHAGRVIRALRHGFLERVEIDHQKVDRADPVRLHRRDMRRVVAQRQKPAMHHRVQGLDAPVHHLGKAGDLGHVAHRKARLAQRARGAAGRDKLYPAFGQRAAQINQAGLVGDG